MTKINWSTGVEEILELARHETARFHHSYVGTEHILLALAHHGAGRNLLSRLGASELAVRNQVERHIQASPSMTEVGLPPPFTPRSTRVLDFAAEEALGLKCGTVQAKHLLAGLILEEGGLAATVLREFGVTYQKCHDVSEYESAEQERACLRAQTAKIDTPAPVPEIVLTVTKIRSTVFDPPVTLWLVTVNDGVGEWRETYGSEAEKDAFVRGVKAATDCRIKLTIEETEK